MSVPTTFGILFRASDVTHTWVTAALPAVNVYTQPYYKLIALTVTSVLCRFVFISHIYLGLTKNVEAKQQFHAYLVIRSR